MLAKSKQQLVGKIPKGIGCGLAVSMASTAATAAIGALLLFSEKVGEGNAGYIAASSLLLSSCLGALAATGIIKEKRFPVCLAVAIGYFLLLLATTALFFGGKYKGAGESGLLILAGVVSVALLGPKGQKITKKRKRK